MELDEMADAVIYRLKKELEARMIGSFDYFCKGRGLSIDYKDCLM